MKDLSLFLLDIAENSVTAGAKLIQIELLEADGFITLRIEDDGCGMSPEFLARVTDPFTTTRTTRKVGMGIPLLKMTAEQTGGSFSIRSEEGVGTCTTARFVLGSLDTPPTGDTASSLITLIQGNSEPDFLYTRAANGRSFTLDTRQLREVMDPVPLSEPEVLAWIRDYLMQQEAALYE